MDNQNTIMDKKKIQDVCLSDHDLTIGILF